jgi:NADPH:quinone reductase-like Zn-dependent oxidoreductase
MHAIVINEWGGRDRLTAADVPEPPVAPDGVLVRVRAAGVNPVDTKIREGHLAGAFPHHFPLIPGWDAAGVVEQVGPAVTTRKVGEEVFGYCRRHELQFGTYAQFVTVPEHFLASKPAALSFEEAAAVPLAGLTAHQALDAVGLRAGETLFVDGGSGGVGHFAIQLGVARGARVVAAASQRNQAFLAGLGAEPVDYEAGDVPGQVHALVEGGVDAALDLFGGDGAQQCFAALRPGGRFVSTAEPAEHPNVECHYVFVRPWGDQLRELATLAEEGHLIPHVEEVFPLDRAADAHERIEAGHVRGKLVLRVP